MNYEEATDAICAIFHDAWDPQYPVKWDDVPKEEMPDGDTPWAKVILQHTDGGLSSLGGANLLRKWRRDGVIFVQVFAPAGQGKTLALQLGQVVVDAYQDAHIDVQFTQVQLNEFGRDGAFYRVDVSANFDYDDVR